MEKISSSIKALRPDFHGFVTDWSAVRPLDIRRSAGFAVAIGFIAGLITWAFLHRPDAPSDFFHYWSAARTLLTGGDPYAVIAEGPANPGRDPTLYPLPALLLIAPLAWLPLPLAGGLFLGVSSALAAWALARTGADRLPLFLSAPFLMAMTLGQWSPLLVASCIIPALGVVVSAKPTLGLACFFAKPSWKTVVAVAVLLAISLVVMPRWPAEWLTNVSHREEKFIPVLRPAGFLLAAGIVAWRRPEGRLFAVMLIVPQALYFYDQLLLWLMPRTLKQSLFLSGWSLVAYFHWWWRWVARPDSFYVREAVPYAYSIYFAALGVLLWNWWRDPARSFGARPDRDVQPAATRSSAPSA